MILCYLLFETTNPVGWSQVDLDASFLGTDGVWLGPQQSEPMGDGSEGERSDPWGLCLQVAQWLLEGQDGELQISSDHIWQRGPPVGLG